MTAIRKTTIAFSLLMATIAAVAVALPHAPPRALPKAGWTRHAKMSHKGELIDAIRMVAMIKNGGCRDMEIHACPEPAVKILCRLNDSMYGGLIVGTAGIRPVILTGYAGGQGYWQNNVDGCDPLDGLPFALP